MHSVHLAGKNRRDKFAQIVEQLFLAEVEAFGVRRQPLFVQAGLALAADMNREND